MFLYVFDATLIFLVTFILAAFDPSKVMTADDDGNIVSPDGSMPEEAMGTDSRHGSSTLEDKYS